MPGGAVYSYVAEFKAGKNFGEPQRSNPLHANACVAAHEDLVSANVARSPLSPWHAQNCVSLLTLLVNKQISFSKKAIVKPSLLASWWSTLSSNVVRTFTQA